MVYTMANPVSAGLVAHQRSWPGLVTTPAHCLGKPLKATRPSYFRAEGTMPKTAELTITRPPVWSDIDDKRFVEIVSNLCNQTQIRLEAG